MKNPDISVVIPNYNEARFLPKTLERVEQQLKLMRKASKSISYEIIVIDDGSKDESGSLLKKWAKESPAHKIQINNRNRGKGSALRDGFILAQGEVIIIQDADWEYNPTDYPRLLAPIWESGADVVYGSRFVGSDAHRVIYFTHSVANQILTMLSNLFTNLNLSDMEVGYKVFTKKVIDQIKDNLESERFGFEPEVTARIGKLARNDSLSVYEVGITYNGRSYAEGKKIGLKDFFEALWCIVKYNLQ